MTGVAPSVSAVNTLASHFRKINQRLASLERASTSGSGALVQVPYTYSNSTTMADPGSGHIRMNNVNPTVATQVAQSVYDRNGTLRPEISNGQLGDEFTVYEASDATHWVKYRLTAAPTITASLWASIPVTVVAIGSGGFAPSNNADLDIAVRSVTTLSVAVQALSEQVATLQARVDALSPPPS